MMGEAPPTETFLMQIRDNTYWANEHARGRHIFLRGKYLSAALNTEAAQ